MQIFREIRTIHTDRIEIDVPEEFKEKEVEILVLPLEPNRQKARPRKPLRLTTYKCHGKKSDFSREDAYFV
jgi:hypothetical protein